MPTALQESVVAFAILFGLFTGGFAYKKYGGLAVVKALILIFFKMDD